MREITTECLAQTLARFKEILAIGALPATQDEEVAAFKANLRRMTDSK